jgi:hypothetical protein
MLIINESGAAKRSVLGIAFEGRCCLVLIRIAAYRNRSGNQIYARFDGNNPFLQPHMIGASVAFH